MVQERLKVSVVPHFMRLHEWIALEEGYFQEEGLEPELLTDVMHHMPVIRFARYPVLTTI